MDDRLSLSVTHADGGITRWGPNEVEAGNVPSDPTFSTSMPGGFRDLSCSLLRRIDLDYPDQGLFDNVRAYGPGNRTAWDGRFTQFPRSHGQGFSVTPGAVGWSAHLKDDPSFRQVYIDRDLGQWRETSRDRRMALLSGGTFTPYDAAIKADTSSGIPALGMEVDDEWTTSSRPICEAVYDAGPGLGIGFVRFSWNRSSTTTSSDWVWRLISSTGDDSASLNVGEATSDLQNEPNATGSSAFTPSASRRFMMLQLFWNAAVASNLPGLKSAVYWYDLAVVGDHGLTERGTAPTNGFYASDVISDIIPRAAPLLGTSGIEDTDFVITHLAFPDPIDAQEAIERVNTYHLWEWGVYDDREFFYRPTDPDRLTWEARLDQGAFLDLEGDTAEQVFNGVYVTYQEITGTRKTIGPTGASADATSALLADTSETNPVNAHGIPRRWAKLEISQPISQAGAEQLGYVWLREHSLPQRRGTLNLTGAVTHPTEGDVPVWRVRAGDYIKPTDMAGYVPRRIISTAYSHATRSLSCELDNTSLKLDAILERLGVGLVGVL